MSHFQFLLYIETDFNEVYQTTKQFCANREDIECVLGITNAPLLL